MNKKELRARFIDTLTYFQAYGDKTKVERIYYSLATSDEWKNANVIGITLSFDYELDTIPLIEHAIELGKTVVVPKCNPADKSLTFYKIDHFEQVEVGHYDIPEPIVSKCEEVNLENIDLLVVPGLAFNFDGYRLGHGGGYYDRILSEFKGTKVGLAISDILTNELVIEGHDVPVDMIFTEFGGMNCNR